MIKKILIIAVVILLAGYLVASVFYWEPQRQNSICQSFRVETRDSVSHYFVDVAAMEKAVEKAGLNPCGKKLKDINTEQIEQEVLKNQTLRSAQVFITAEGEVVVEVQSKEPVLRISTVGGENYYLDKDTAFMPIPTHVTAYLPLATGHITRTFARRELFPLVMFLRNNSFWNAQIEQIDVQPDGEVVLIPRVGDQKILLGKPQNFETKLERLLTFYKEGMYKAGWNNYRTINLKYDNQIVCAR